MTRNWYFSRHPPTIAQNAFGALELSPCWSRAQVETAQMAPTMRLWSHTCNLGDKQRRRPRRLEERVDCRDDLAAPSTTKVRVQSAITALLKTRLRHSRGVRFVLSSQSSVSERNGMNRAPSTP